MYASEINKLDIFNHHVAGLDAIYEGPQFESHNEDYQKFYYWLGITTCACYSGRVPLSVLNLLPLCHCRMN